jgi:hypothetical protein
MAKVFHFDENNNVVESDWLGPIVGESKNAEPEHHGIWGRLGGMYSTDPVYLKAWRLRVERQRFKEMQESLLRSLGEGLHKWLALEQKLTS